jgi:Electron transfer DM13.
MKISNSIIMISFVAAASLATVTAAPSYAQSPSLLQQVQSQSFFKKKYKIKGSWSLIQRDGKNIVKFSDDFKTKNGPDLKVFLSPTPAQSVNGKNAVQGSINLGVLKTNKGGQEYEIPAGTDLSKFSTVLVHCEAYSVLWGGGSL